MNQTLIPLHDRVLLDPVSGDNVRKSGIIIPETAHNTMLMGRVVDVGLGCTTEFVVGQLLLIDPMRRPTMIQLNEKVYWMIAEKDIIGLIKETV